MELERRPYTPSPRLISSKIAVTDAAAVQVQPQTIDVVRDSSAKRALDLLLATAMLIASAPLWVLVALAIKLEDGGPVFYFQERWGRGGQIFRVRKFRTMIQNAGLRQAEQNDRRITRVGHFLRACGMDELPQILNIWRGEMSFVGPRALAVGELVRDSEGNYSSYELVPGFWERLAVRPGLTGIATIYIPKDAPPRRKFRYDMLYIRRRSFWLDLRLIVMSFWISFRGKWETRERKL
ncbi:MAG: sugar transferase [Oscillochloridaceae bacterium umkhey_bin13]